MGAQMDKEYVMQCARCGADIASGDRHCGRCGAPVLRLPTASDETRHIGGVPVPTQAPSVYGPPVVGSALPVGATEITEVTAPPRRFIGYRPIMAPPALPARPRIGCIGATLLGVALLALLVAGGAFAHAHGSLPLFGGASQPTVTNAQRTATALANVCPHAAKNAGAARLLTHPQMTTGLYNAAKQDFRPINAVTTFHVGQQAYITFLIATAEAGSASVNFCTPGEQIPGSLTVPAGAVDRYAEFAVRFTARDVGRGLATLSWNGAVAATLPYTVTP